MNARTLTTLVFFTLLLSACTSTAHEQLTITTSNGSVTLNVEIADEPEERRQGLMGRDSLPEDHGMLFVFSDEQRRAFWMKNTSIPLSIAYISEDGTIVDIKPLQPYNETPVRSAAPARYALETNRGFFARHGISTGDRADLSGTST